MKKIAKMQNLSQNELNQIRRIKNYEEMSKEELIISLLKSKQSIANPLIIIISTMMK